MIAKYRKQFNSAILNFSKDTNYILYWNKFESKCKRCKFTGKKIFKYTFIHRLDSDFDDELKVEAIAKLYGYEIIDEELSSRYSKYTFIRGKSNV
jgi:hypothetical protein